MRLLSGFSRNNLIYIGRCDPIVSLQCSYILVAKNIFRHRAIFLGASHFLKILSTVCILYDMYGAYILEVLISIAKL